MTKTYSIVTISGTGLPTTTDATGYDTRLAAEAMAEEFHDGEYQIVSEAVTYTVRGLVRGELYRGRSERAAIRALAADRRACRARRGYSDAVLLADGSEVDDTSDPEVYPTLA